jgi:hypothetical protein
VSKAGPEPSAPCLPRQNFWLEVVCMHPQHFKNVQKAMYEVFLGTKQHSWCRSCPNKGHSKGGSCVFWAGSLEPSPLPAPQSTSPEPGGGGGVQAHQF